jgi:hypothetical protein
MVKIVKYKFSSTEKYTLEEMNSPQLRDKLWGRTYTIIEE